MDMKKKLILLLVFSLSQVSLNAQFGEESKEVQNLKDLAKVWGYVKYFHPEVQECNIDWDNALIDALMDLDGAPQEDVAIVLEELLDKAGPLDTTPGAIPELDDDPEINNLNLDWLDSEHFSETIKSKLNNIYTESRRRDHCNLEPVFTDGNLVFEEEPYDNLGQYPNIYYRLLAVFRYWNAIEYFFPYKHIMDQDWDATFDQFVLPIAYSENSVNYNFAFKEMTTYIDDSHSFFNSSTFYQKQGSHLVPFVINWIEGKTVVTDIDDSVNELEVGDIILSLNNIPIEEYRDSIYKYVAGSNEVTRQRNVNNWLRWGNAGFFEVTVEKADGSTQSITNLYRDYTEFLSLHTEDVGDSWEIIKREDCSYGYIHMGRLEAEEIPDMINDLWSYETIVFDIRNYPNGTLWSLIPYLYDHSITIAAFATPDYKYAGQFYWNDVTLGYNTNNNIYSGKIIILFNEHTQSQAEYTVMGLEQYPDAVKIGSQTSGADGNVSTMFLPGQITVYFTGLGIYYPDGTPTQRVGLVPDIEVRPTISGIRNGIDEVLEFALNCALDTMIMDPDTMVVDPDTMIMDPDTMTGTDLVFFEDLMKFYPNPFDNFLQIINTSNDIKEVNIFDVRGKLISTENVINSKMIDVSYLTSGIYIAQWNDKNQLMSQKLVKH